MPGGVSSSANLGSSQSTSSTQVVPGMLDVYNQLLGLNQQNYGNILNSYNQGSQQLNQQLPGIYGGYQGVLGGVMNTLGQGRPLGGDNWGVATPAAQAIGQTFAQQRGQTDQQMINAGLGNTTVRGNLQNQNALMAGQAYGGLGAQLAQTAAGYQANLGMAGLGAQMQGAGMQAQMAQHQGQTLGGYHFANTAGSLTGQNANARSNNQGTSFASPGGSNYAGSGRSGGWQDWSGSSAPPAPWEPNPYAVPGGQYTDPSTLGRGGNYFGQGDIGGLAADAAGGLMGGISGTMGGISNYFNNMPNAFPGIAIGGGDLEGGGDIG